MAARRARAAIASRLFSGPKQPVRVGRYRVEGRIGAAPGRQPATVDELVARTPGLAALAAAVDAASAFLLPALAGGAGGAGSAETATVAALHTATAECRALEEEQATRDRLARLESEGMIFATQSFDLGGWQIAFARDPEGNLVAFQQSKPVHSIEDMRWFALTRSPEA